MRIAPLILALSPVALSPVNLLAQQGEATDAKASRPLREVIIHELPGFYEFYMKTGAQETLRQERSRDRQIEAGELVPIRMNEPLPPLSLPLPNGEQLDFLDYKGKKNLVIVSYRSWW